jgi:hypothetical protein
MGKSELLSFQALIFLNRSVGWVEQRETQQSQQYLQRCWVSFFNPTYELIVPVWGELAVAIFAIGILPARYPSRPDTAAIPIA